MRADKPGKGNRPDLESAIRLYEYLARRILGRMPRPTRAEMREYLSRRLEETSPAGAETERKALASLFSFLYEEGLWPENPLDGVRHIGERYGESERRCPSDSPFLFPGRTRTGYAEIYNVEKTLNRACLRAGVEPFTPHQLRHFYATEMLRKGAKLEVVGRILGHASIGITVDIYRHVRTEEMHEEHERFAPLNGKAEEDVS